ncbi:hypothetical protein C8Q76DRAFT_793501 [Earliella scabrosa]|nr:hypothetical protein C8Q76DRAFT_793501 [Earliella scabrosa]
MFIAQYLDKEKYGLVGKLTKFDNRPNEALAHHQLGRVRSRPDPQSQCRSAAERNVFILDEVGPLYATLSILACQPLFELLDHLFRLQRELSPDSGAGMLIRCGYKLFRHETIDSIGADSLRQVIPDRDPDVLSVETALPVSSMRSRRRTPYTVYGDEALEVFSVPSPTVIAFDYDLPRSALATISEDSTLTMWNIRDKLPFWSHKIRGDDTPSSLIFVDGGVIVGRENGTIFQLLPVMGHQVLSTVKFVDGDQEDAHMFGHANYDSRINTLWIANNRRESMIAFKLNFDIGAPSPGGEDVVRGAYFEQVVEFSGPKPTIHFVIPTADADPHGDEAHAACVAAKVPPGELALVSFSVHSTGVDQLPPMGSSGTQFFPPGASPLTVPLPRTKTPPSEEVEAPREEVGRGPGKGKNAKGKIVGWKDSNKDSEREKADKRSDAELNAETAAALTREIKKSEESLHNRLGRLISKELDKQHQRLEEVRQSEQAADFVRQEKILKLISTDLTKNTTRVNSVLPSLENITKQEVKAALSNQIAKGVSDAMKMNERVLVRPEMANQVARAFSTSVTPVIERQVKESISKNLIPSSAMHQELGREIRSEILNLKKEVLAWQGDALRSQESVIRELEQSVRLLSDQVKYLMSHPPVPSYGHVQNGSSPGPSTIRLPSPHLLPPLLPLFPMPRATPPTSGQPEEWDDTYLAVLGFQDTRQLRELLARRRVSHYEGEVPILTKLLASRNVTKGIVDNVFNVIKKDHRLLSRTARADGLWQELPAALNKGKCPNTFSRASPYM